MFRQLGIYSAAVGQRYTPHDCGRHSLLQRRCSGSDFGEGINEAGAFSAWMAAATSYSVSDYPMIPFFIFLFDVWFSAHR